APALSRTLRPVLEEALRLMRFVCDYPLGCARADEETADEAEGGLYHLHACLGARIPDAGEAYACELPLRLQDGLPFVVTPDGSRLLYLWPLLAQRVSAISGRPTLYLFQE